MTTYHTLPPRPDFRCGAGEEDVHLYEPPTALLTSEEIRARFAQEKVEEEKHGKTIDQIILENTKGNFQFFFLSFYDKKLLNNFSTS